MSVSFFYRYLIERYGWYHIERYRRYLIDRYRWYRLSDIIMGGYRYKGSKVDRAFSYSKIDAVLRENARLESQRRYSGHGYSDRKSSSPFASNGRGKDAFAAGASFSSNRGSGFVETVSSASGGAASAVGSMASSIAAGIGRVMAAPIAPSTSPSAGGGGGGSAPDDLADDEYIDEYGVRRKKRRGMHR